MDDGRTQGGGASPQTDSEVPPPALLDSGTGDGQKLGGRRHRRRPPLTRRQRVALGLVLLGLVVIPALVAYALSARSAEIYEARAEILVPAPSGTSATSQAISTQLTLLTSRGVLQPVAAQAGLPLSALTSSVSAEQLGSGQVISLAVQNESADQATELAQSILDGYLAVAREAPAATADVEYLHDLLAEQEAELATLQPSGAALPQSAERELLVSRISDLRDQLTAAEISHLRTAPPANVITEPYSVGEPVRPNPGRAALGGAIAGVLLAAILFFLVLRPTPRVTAM